MPEVDHAVGVAVGPVSIDSRTRQASVLDPTASTGLLVPEPVTGSVAELGPGEIAVGEALADDKDWRIGTSLPVRFTDGVTEELTVSAIYEPSTTLEELIIPTATWSTHQVQSVDNLVIIGLADGVDVETGRAAVEAATTSFAPPDVQTTQEFIDDATARVDQILGLIYAMLGLAIVIALMGIANTLSLSIHERVRELGLLRAVGAARAQMRAMIRWESVVIAIFGTARRPRPRTPARLGARPGRRSRRVPHHVRRPDGPARDHRRARRPRGRAGRLASSPPSRPRRRDRRARHDRMIDVTADPSRHRR